MKSFSRHRRLRSGENIRRMVREHQVSPDDFIYPLFVVEGSGIKKKFLPCQGCSIFPSTV